MESQQLLKVNTGMIITLAIRKILLTEQYNSSYFINIAKLLQESRSDELSTALFELFQAGENFRAERRTLFSLTENPNLRLHVQNESSLIGFSSLGVVSKDYFDNVIVAKTSYPDLLEKTTTFSTLLGWTMLPLKFIECEVGEYDKATTLFSQYPMQFDRISTLYDNASLT